MKKKAILFIIPFMILITINPFSFCSAYSLNKDEYSNNTTDTFDSIRTGQLNDNISWFLFGGSLTISGNGYMPDLDYLVTPWNDFSSDIYIVNVEDGVKSIGKNAFAEMDNLRKVSLPEGLIIIGESAFANCIHLKKIEIPVSVTEINTGAFNGCNSLNEVYYNQQKKEWEKLSIHAQNDAIINASKHFNQGMFEVPDYNISLNSLDEFINTAKKYIEGLIEEYEDSDKNVLVSLNHKDSDYNIYYLTLEKTSDDFYNKFLEDTSNDELRNTGKIMLNIKLFCSSIELELSKANIVGGILKESPEWFYEYGVCLYEMSDYLDNEAYLNSEIDFPDMPTALDELFNAILNGFNNSDEQ